MNEAIQFQSLNSALEILEMYTISSIQVLLFELSLRHSDI